MVLVGLSQPLLLTADPSPSSQVRPLLPALVPVLLESLSGLEDARLNYVEQVSFWGRGAFWALLWGVWAQGLLCRAGGVLDKPITEGLALVAQQCAATGIDQPQQVLLTQSTCCLPQTLYPRMRSGTAWIRPAWMQCVWQPAAPAQQQRRWRWRRAPVMQPPLLHW